MANVDPHTLDPSTWAVPNSNTLMRSHFAKTGNIPTVTEIRENLGELISKAVFDSIPPELKENMGLEQKLKGPEGSLWCSPSDQLLGQLRLTKLPSQRHVHVMTHQAILEIGGNIEKMVTKIIEKELEKKLAEQEENFEKTLEERVQSVRKKVIREFYELSAIKLRELFDRMEADFKNEWEKRENHLTTEAEKLRLEALNLLEEKLRSEFDDLARHREEKYVAQLQFETNRARADAHDTYHHKLSQMQEKWAQLFRDTQEAEKLRNKAELNQLIACEETRLWSTITRERESVDTVLYEVVKFNKNQLMSLNDEIVFLRDKFADVCKQRDEHIDDIEAWKCVLRDLFREFQNFINFVLNEIPGQAGYLLSLTEIMNKRKECLPRVREDAATHRSAPQNKMKNDTWDDVLVRPIDPKLDPNLYEWKSSIDVDDEDNDRRRLKDERKEEEYLKILAKGKRNEECANMIKTITQWVLNKVEGFQITPPASLPSSTASQEASLHDSDVTAVIDSDLLKYAQFMEKCIPETIMRTRDAHMEVESKKPREKQIFMRDGLLGPVNVDIEDDSKKVSPEPFVTSRINSILNILDAHPHLKSAISGS